MRTQHNTTPTVRPISGTPYTEFPQRNGPVQTHLRRYQLGANCGQRVMLTSSALLYVIANNPNIPRPKTSCTHRALESQQDL